MKTSKITRDLSSLLVDQVLYHHEIAHMWAPYISMTKHPKYPTIPHALLYGTTAKNGFFSEAAEMFNGVIVDLNTKTILSRPNDKLKEPSPNTFEFPLIAYDMLDGTELFTYYEESSGYRLVTRDSFENPVTQAANHIFEARKKIPQIQEPTWTYLFTLVHPSFPKKIKYHGKKMLILTGIRDVNGEYQLRRDLTEIATFLETPVLQEYSFESKKSLEEYIQTQKNKKGLLIPYQGEMYYAKTTWYKG